MGLDMYMEGEKFSHSRNRVKIDGFERKSEKLELAYWRKHPNLHGYIVDTFANGLDECQEIELSEDDLDKLITAIENDQLPDTNGFFFGQSPKQDGSNPDWGNYQEQKKEDVVTITRARTWLLVREDDVFKSVIYRASW